MKRLENVMNAAKNVGCGCAIGAVGLLVLLVLPFLIGTVCLCVRTLSSNGIDGSGYGSSRPECERPLDEKWMCGDGSEDDPKVVYIPIHGEITSARSTDFWLGDEANPFETMLRSIRAAARDEDVRGLYLHLDTPGGTVTDSDILADAVARFRASGKDRFVFVLMGSTCCSGGYYVAAGADHIMAHPTTMTGSIGVIMNAVNAAELAKKVGVASVTIASGANKSLLDPLEPVNPEHVKIMRRPVEQDYERFVSIVAKGRRLPVEQVRPLADGRILSAADAREAKLIDSIGYDEDARKKLAEMAHAKKIRVYRYEEPFSWRHVLSSPGLMKLGRAFVNGMRAGLDDVPRNEYRMH